MTPKQFLEQQKYFTLSVLHEHQPWAVTLAIKSYSDGIITWFSKLDTIHSQAIEGESDVAVSAFSANDDTGEKFGISARATARLAEELPGGVGRYEATITHLNYTTEAHIKHTVEPAEL